MCDVDSSLMIQVLYQPTLCLRNPTSMQEKCLQQRICVLCKTLLSAVNLRGIQE